MADGCLDHHWAVDADGCAQLRRTCRDDAQGRWPIRLPARSILTDVGIPLRMDFVSGDSDRHCRSGRGWFRKIPWSAVAKSLRRQLHRRPHPRYLRLRYLSVDGTACRRVADCAAYVYEHARTKARQAGSKRIHNHEDRKSDRTNPAGRNARLER